MKKISLFAITLSLYFTLLFSNVYASDMLASDTIVQDLAEDCSELIVAQEEFELPEQSTDNTADDDPNEEVVVHEHVLVTEAEKTATCTEYGFTELTYCSECGEIISGGYEIPPIGHLFLTYESNHDATYTTDGTKTAICENGCGSSDTMIDIGSKIRLKTPSLTKLSNGSTGVGIFWNAVAGAENYRVYRKTADSSWKRIGDTSNTSFTDTKAVSGTVYYYTVRCITQDGQNIISDYDKAGLSTLYLASPQLAKLTNEATYIQFSWSQVAGSPTYYVYRKTQNSGWTRLGTTTGLIWKDKTAINGVKYIYTVKAGKGTTYSAYDTKGLSIIALKQPTPVSLTNQKTGIDFSWQEVTNTSGYYVYRKTTGSWARIATISNGQTTHYLDTTAINGTNYTYTVKAYIGSTYSRYHSGYSVPRVTVPEITNLTTNYTGDFTLSWKKNPTATGYQIQYAVNSNFTDGIILSIKNNTTFSKKVSSLSSGTYYVRVRCYQNANDRNNYSVWSSSKKIEVKNCKINLSSLTMNVGDNKTLRISDLSSGVTWTSSNSSVASVTSTGTVKAVKGGTATITGKYNGKSFTCTVKVNAQTSVSTSGSYVANKSSGVFHRASCSSVNRMKESNKYYYNGSRSGLISMGYTPCKNCRP